MMLAGIIETEQPGAQQRLGGGIDYGAIYADPPWRFDTYSEAGRDRCPDGRSLIADAPLFDRRPFKGAAARHYETMTLDDIKAMRVGAHAAPDCALFMWAVSAMLPQAMEVGAAWGFTFKTVAFVWAKTLPPAASGWPAMNPPRLLASVFPIGTGYWTRANPELCLLFTRGSPQRVSRAVRQLVVAPRREHSRKPEEVRHSIERLVGGPYLELFAREAAPGWDAWGDQVARFAP